MIKKQFMRFEYEETLEPKVRELVALSAALVAGCSH